MTDDDPLAAFEAHRARLFGVAYRMLGSAADADNVLQDARLRWLACDRAAVRDVRGFLVTMVTRQALDVLGSARARREQYVGPWLPEPIATAPAAHAHDLSLALLRLLERLSPAERAAFLLAEVFDYSHAEVAAILDKTEDACRQLAARARKAVRDGRPRPVDASAHATALSAFLTACASGDVAGLERLLAADAAVISDGGGRVRAALNIVTGANAVARMLVGLTRKSAAGLVPRLAAINGELALVLDGPAGIDSVLTLELDPAATIITAVCIVRNPDKLGAVATPRPVA